VGFDSIEAAVGDGDHGGDHFVLVALEGEIWGHHGSEGAEGVEHDVGEEGVGANDAVFESAIDAGSRGGVFDGVELALFKDEVAETGVVFEAEGFDPGH